jgi:hypothetical protein
MPIPRGVLRTKAIPGFPDYEVSTYGDVWEIDFFHGSKKLLKQKLTGRTRQKRLSRAGGKNGVYLHVYLKPRGLDPPKRRNVHSLVLETFVGPRPPGMEARHINGNHLDNRLTNLRWGTKKENEADRVAHDRGAFSKLTARLVRDMRERYDRGEVTVNQLAAEGGVSEHAIINALTYKSWKHVP